MLLPTWALRRAVESRGVPTGPASLCQVDGMLEAEKDGKAIGTTKRGIGPCYASKVL